MDAPSTPSILFDPEAEQPDEGYQSNSTVGPRPIDVRLAAYTEQPRLLYISQAQAEVLQPQPAGQPQPQPGGQPPMGGQPPQPGAGPGVIVAPNPDTRVIPLPDLGGVVIVARNKDELERIKQVIKLFLGPNSQLAKDAQITLKIIPLEYADSTQLVNELSQIFSRLQLQSGSLTFPAQRGGLGAGGFGGQFNLGGQQGQAFSSLVVFPLPRYNSILVGAPASSEKVIVDQIKLLDRPNAPSLQPKPYQLKWAAASIVQTQLLNLFRQRYPTDTGNNIQVTVDTANNRVLVQAGPADQRDIATFIELLDSEPGTIGGGAFNEVKVIKLNNAFASDMATVLFEVLQSNVYNPQASAVSSGGAATQGANQFGTGLGGIAQQQQQGGFGGQGGLQVQLTGGTTASTKSTILRLTDKDGRQVHSGLLADVSITPDARINALVVSAPEKTMKMIEALLKELDGVAAAKSYLKVFQLKKMDATAVQTLLVNLFSRQTTGAGGLGGAGGFGTAQTQGITRPLLTLTGNPGDGSALIDIRLTVDTRTNSIIVAGSQNDLDTIDAVIGKLESTPTQQYVTEVVKLKNAAAADVQFALNTFLTTQVQSINNLQQVTANTGVLGLQRAYTITPEPVTNQLIIGATPALMPEILRLINAVDAAPPQVYVEVLIAEVRLNNQEEFGVEIGLQSDVLFARGGATAGGAPGTPGYNFNTTSALPNAANVNPSKVGFQGLGTLGVGRASQTLGVGGFVLSAASDSFSLLIRALKAQGRVDVLSRPSLSLADNQTGFFQVGQSFPQIQGSTVNAQGFVQNDIVYTPIGVVMRVTPRISPDGQVLMRVEPQVSSVSDTQVAVGNGVFAQAIDTQTVETTVLAGDGETVVLGGLIRKADVKLERKIPWLGDLPYLGAAFRYRTQTMERREIVFVMTPRIMRTQADMRAVMAAEAKKMSWSINDVANVTGVNPDVFRGKLGGSDPAACIDQITGPAPTYLPLSPNGAIAPTYYPTPVYGQAPLYAPPPAQPGPQMTTAVPPQQPTAPQPYSTYPQPQPVSVASPSQVAPPNGYAVPTNVPGSLPQQQPPQPTMPVQPAVQQSAYQPAPGTPPPGWTPGPAPAGGPPPQPWAK